MNYATLYHGQPAEVADELEKGPATPDELRAALTNALNRIAALESAAITERSKP